MLEMKEYEIDFVKESISFYEVINEEESSNKNKKSVLEKIKKMLLKIKNFLVNIYKKFKKFIVNLINKIKDYSKKEEAYIAEIDKVKKENEKIKKANSSNYIIHASEKKEINDKIMSKKKALSEIKIRDGYEGLIEKGNIGLLKELYTLTEIKYFFMSLKGEVDINSSEKEVKKSVKHLDELISDYRNYKSSLKTISAEEAINETNASDIKYYSMKKIDSFTNELKLFSKDMDKIYKEVEGELNEDLERAEYCIKAVKNPESIITKEDIDELNMFIASNRKKLTYINFLNTEISYIIPTIVTERKNILKAVKLGIEIETLQNKLKLIK
ncbi:hypothetical protein CPT_Machias_162 [Staphylococcus phage Machias]|nr:hypothetical protein CPT_Machias_162 [Staphylococcus phage Machias]